MHLPAGLASLMTDENLTWKRLVNIRATKEAAVHMRPRRTVFEHLKDQLGFPLTVLVREGKLFLLHAWTPKP